MVPGSVPRQLTQKKAGRQESAGVAPSPIGQGQGEGASIRQEEQLQMEQVQEADG